MTKKGAHFQSRRARGSEQCSIGRGFTLKPSTALVTKGTTTFNFPSDDRLRNIIEFFAYNTGFIKGDVHSLIRIFEGFDVRVYGQKILWVTLKCDNIFLCDRRKKSNHTFENARMIYTNWTFSISKAQFKVFAT